MTGEDDDQKSRALAARAAAGAVGAAVGLAGPGGALAGAALTPVLERAFVYLDKRFFRQRMVNAAETLADAAQAAGVEDDEFEMFVEKLARDEQHRELLARVLSAAQDSAMRDKRRALGRVLANAADDTGTKVDSELADARVIADLDAVHIRVLRIMSEAPRHLAEYAIAHGVDPQGARRWHPYSIAGADSGLADAAWGAVVVLERHGLITKVGEGHTPNGGWEPEYEITGYGDYLVKLLAAPYAAAAAEGE
ncbi:hypothetical protein [Paractinoplanes hotanensis]|uniref:DUF4393 domain-containing protein n=1 Tax=Paractinoplanes hotanensis TaxID=2906497 RepID=A0ABT0YCV6_9ACTN|nr:hypothetical protein [Actinoplanes hotanensis]MCM4083896.1 hypothetical protein [Actinoplanes hotanensis]